MIHGIQLGRCGGQEPHRDMYGLGHLPTGRGRMRRAPIFKQHKTPPPPLSADEAEKNLMRGLIPYIGDEERHVPTPDVDGPMEDTLGMAPSHRHFHLLPSPAIAMVEGWSFQDDRFVE